VRRYELMLIIRPDAPDEKAAAVIDRTTRYVVASGGQIVKVAPWGRRRLAYPIDRHREGSYHIVVFESPAEAIAELERSLEITEEVIRYLVTRATKPVKARRDAGVSDGVDESESEESDEGDESEEGGARAERPSAAGPEPADESDEDGEDAGRIDESESEAAPAAID
jgi:small subunit ribosomal protein S6